MKTKFTTSFILSVFLSGTWLNGSAQLVVTAGPPGPAVTPATLVSTILGPGVIASNITYTGATASKGTFTASGTNLGMPNGIILSSGDVSSAGGANAPASVFHSSAMNGNSDPQLDALVSPNQSLDASVLEFDFSVASDSVHFNYVFGSEEYNDWVNTSFNDVFGFFISGPGLTPNTNIAIVPGTASTIVSINNVNNGGPYPGLSSGPCNHCAYYVDNVNGSSVFLDGFTTLLEAKSVVQPCEQYHIKLAVSDVSDQIYDSDVFIKGGSFSSLGQIGIFANAVSLPDNDTVYGCPGGTITLSVNPAGNYNWSTGETTQSIVVPVPAIGAPLVQYSAFVINLPCFVYTTTVWVAVAPPTATISGINSICAGGNTTLSANPGNAYQWSTGATTQNINVTTSGTFTVTVTNGPGCSATSAPFIVTVGPASASITGPAAICSGAAANLQANMGTNYLWSTGETTQNISVASTGTYTVTVTQPGGCTATALQTINLASSPVPFISGINTVCAGTLTSFDAGGGGPYTGYQWSTGATTQTIVPLSAVTYTVTVTNASGCTATATQNLIINPLPNPNIAGIPALCQGAASNLDAGGGYSAYQWNGGASTQLLNVTASGTYTVTVTDGAGCTGSASIAVNVSSLPVPAINGINSICAGANTSFDAGAGFSNYAWSNGGNTQTINAGSSGPYTVTVTDANGCTGSASITLTVNPNPVPAIAGITSICQGANSIFDAGIGYSTYSWTGGNTTQTINVNTSGTYTVTVTDLNGCTGTTSLSLTVNANPAPVITGINSICQGTNTTFDAGPGFTVYQWSSGASTQTVNLNTSGTYTVTVTNNNGCTNSANYALIVNPLPSPAISGNASICQGSATTFDAGAGYSIYQWSTGDVTQMINLTSQGTYTVTVTDNNGCSASTALNLVVNANPLPAISGINVICQGTPTTFDAGPGYNMYQWSSGGNSQTINPTMTGTYTVTVTDINNCTGTASYNLLVNPLPNPAISGVNSICQGTNTIFDAGAGFSAYQWSTGDVTQTVNLNTSGTYTVTVTDLNGCTNSANYTLVVNALPNPVINGSSAICQGTATIFDAGNGYSVYQWSTGDVTQTVNLNAAGTYTVTVTDGNGCSSSATMSLIVNPNPVPAISGVNVICQGTPTTFDAGSGYAMYQWSSGGNSQTINPTTTGTYTVTVTDGNNCTGTGSYDLLVNQLPNPVISGVNSICQGANTIFDAGMGFNAYQWSTGDNSQTVNLNASGTYTVTVTDGNGCTNSANYILTVNALPTPSITGNNSICDGSTTNFDPGAGFSVYQWSNGSSSQVLNTGTSGTYTVTVTNMNGCSGSASMALVVNALPVPSITGKDSICDGFASVIDAGAGYSAYQWSNGANSQTITVTLAGTYSVIITDANGCTGTDAFKLEVLTAEAGITPDGAVSFCDGDQVTLLANTGLSYQWSGGETTQSVVINTSGTYTVTVMNNNGCSAISSPLVVSVHPYPVVRFSNDSTGLCGALRVNFINLSTYDPGSVFKWEFGDGSYSSIASPTHDYKTVGNYIVILTITSPYGCESKESDTINVDFPPEAMPLYTMSSNLAPLFDAKIDFTDQSQNAYTWFWSFGDGDTSHEQNPSHYYDTPGNYNVKLMVTNRAGCEKEIIDHLMIAPFWIPNAFTPNGDGRNDVFFTSNYILDVMKFEMIVRNRWGQVVYDTKDFTLPWDGRGNDESISQEGVYVYDIYVKTKTGKEYNFKGTVDLIR